MGLEVGAELPISQARWGDAVAAILTVLKASSLLVISLGDECKSWVPTYPVVLDVGTMQSQRLN